jgi:hypothetical protein
MVQFGSSFVLPQLAKGRSWMNRAPANDDGAR